MPFVEVAATVPLYAMATKTPLPKVIDIQVDDDGKVRVVQVIPSGEVAAMVDPWAIATKTPLP